MFNKESLSRKLELFPLDLYSSMLFTITLPSELVTRVRYTSINCGYIKVGVETPEKSNFCLCLIHQSLLLLP